jgi:hypothetical protein
LNPCPTNGCCIIPIGGNSHLENIMSFHRGIRHANFILNHEKLNMRKSIENNAITNAHPYFLWIRQYIIKAKDKANTIEPLPEYIKDFIVESNAIGNVRYNNFKFLPLTMSVYNKKEPKKTYPNPSNININIRY